MRGDHRQNQKFFYAVLTWCFRLLKCCYALIIWHCKVLCRPFAFNYVFLNWIVFLYLVLCPSVLDYDLLHCIMQNEIMFTVAITQFCSRFLYYGVSYCTMFFCVELWLSDLCLRHILCGTQYTKFGRLGTSGEWVQRL